MKRFYNGNRKSYHDSPNYVKINPNNKHLYKNKLVYYVCTLVPDEISDTLSKHAMGPYNQVTAESIMTQILSEGLCCWIEESKIR